MQSLDLTKTTNVLVSICLFGASVVPVNAAAPTNPFTKAFTTFPQAQVSKWNNAMCGAVYQLAPMRHQSIRLGQMNGLKNKAVNKHVKGLVPKSTIAATEDDDVVSMDCPEPIKESLDMADTCMVPVAYQTQVGGSLIHQNQSNLESWASTKVEQTEENKLIFDEGEAVLSADKPSEFQFDCALVHLQKGAIVLLRQSNGIKRIVNLHDKKRDSVVVETGDKKVFLRPGQECIIACSESALKSFKRRDGSMRRFSKVTTCSGSCEVMGVCEISIPSLLKNHPIVKSIYTSSGKKEREISGKLLKMSVCLAHFSRSYLEYAQEK